MISGISLVGFAFTACQNNGGDAASISESSDMGGGNQSHIKNLSHMKTFFVSKPGGDSVAFQISGAANPEQRTIASVTSQLEAKGYKEANSANTADFIVQPVWLISMSNNPDLKLNPGTTETSKQTPEQIQVARLQLVAKDRASDTQLWQAQSAWPFSVARASIANIQNSVSWALNKFPTAAATPKTVKATSNTKTTVKKTAAKTNVKTTPQTTDSTAITTKKAAAK